MSFSIEGYTKEEMTFQFKYPCCPRGVTRPFVFAIVARIRCLRVFPRDRPPETHLARIGISMTHEDSLECFKEWIWWHTPCILHSQASPCSANSAKFCLKFVGQL